VWKLTVCPLIETRLSALNEPDTVKVMPSVTLAEAIPANDTEALSGKVLVSAPYALLPWLLELTPCPAMYWMVSEDGRFLLFLSQMVHFPGGTNGGGGGGGTGAGGGGGVGAGGQFDPIKSMAGVVVGTADHPFPSMT
jgi:uncharacterized membrane protein YgcG